MVRRNLRRHRLCKGRGHPALLAILLDKADGRERFQDPDLLMGAGTDLELHNHAGRVEGAKPKPQGE